ncbi:MAG: AsmA family protein, partial [Methyloceanibacter sp.]|uniref:AsmA family protein n=1 Tax=Methyloceanibacter sp. TaxID=1965321 RepID=UPI001E174BFE
MNSLLLTLTALFILVLSALFAAPLFIDWNDYRPAFEAHASKLIGRQVKMDGEVHLVVLPAPRLKFDGVRVANADGSLDTPFLEAKSLEAKIDVGTLLTGKVEAHQLTIIDPTLRLHIDGARNGNWTDIGPRRTGTPFVPKDVLLDSVRVTGGTVEIVKEGVSPFVFRNIDGEASAASLAGPYKVSATYDFEGRPQTLRFSTGSVNDSGQFRMKAALRDPNRSASYQLDGLVSGLRATPSYDGSLVMRVSKLDGLGAGEPPQGDAEPMQGVDEMGVAEPETEEAEPRGLRETASFVELKGPLKATPDGAELTGFDLTLHASGRPQILKGTAKLDFRPPFRADARLAARWIDFDALFGAAADEDRPSPAAVVRMFSGWVLDEAARIGQGTLSLDVEQAGLGGDLAGGLALKLASSNGGVTIERLDATLPGENHVTMSGSLRKSDSGPVFDGPLKIDGSGLRALTRWAAGDRAITGQAFVGDFSLSADATIGNGEVMLANANGTVSGTSFGGNFLYRAGETNLISLDLRSDRLDLREALGDEPIWSAWLSSAAGAPAADSASPGSSLLEQLRGDEVHARVQVGELLLPGLTPGRLDAKLSLDRGDLDVQSLAFAAPYAINLNGKGRITSLAEAPSGQIDLSVQALSTESLRAL